MYKVIFSFFSFVFLFSCSSTNGQKWKEWMGENQKLRVLSTTVMIHDLVAEIGKDQVVSLPLISQELDPHSYQLVKGDSEKLSHADLIFYNGLGLEHGASLAYQLKNLSQTVSVGDNIAERYPDKIIWLDGVQDPHIWMDVSIWANAVDPILQHLIRLKPESAEEFRKNALELKIKMLQAHEKIYHKLQKIPNEKRFLVTSHNSFNYFTKTYLESEHEWKERFAAPEGLAPEGQLNPVDLQMIIQYLHHHQIHVVFSESNVNPDSLKKIASASRELGWEVQIPKDCLYSDAMKDFEDPTLSYIKTMEYNADLISRYLQ